MAASIISRSFRKSPKTIVWSAVTPSSSCSRRTALPLFAVGSARPPSGARHHDLVGAAEVGQPGCGVALGGSEVVDRDLEDVVVRNLQQVVDELQPRVVERRLVDEGRARRST